jgi:hypothetical protein
MKAEHLSAICIRLLWVASTIRCGSARSAYSCAPSAQGQSYSLRRGVAAGLAGSCRVGHSYPFLEDRNHAEVLHAKYRVRPRVAIISNPVRSTRRRNPSTTAECSIYAVAASNMRLRGFIRGPVSGCRLRTARISGRTPTRSMPDRDLTCACGDDACGGIESLVFSPFRTYPASAPERVEECV